MATITVHKKFLHNSASDPWDWSGYDQHNIFVAGVDYDVPDGAAEHFIAAGWAALPGEEPVEPDASTPILIQPDSGSAKQENRVR